MNSGVMVEEAIVTPPGNAIWIAGAPEERVETEPSGPSGSMLTMYECRCHFVLGGSLDDSIPERQKRLW